jgi:hypothetical protein
VQPVGQHLLSAAGGEIWCLLAAKAAGTALTCSLLLLLFWQNRRLGSLVTTALASFQFGLLLYLTFG